MLWLAAMALATAPPAKMMILFGGSGIAIVDYPSMARCEQARRELMATIERGVLPAPFDPPRPDGTKLVPLVTAYCFPG